MKPLLIGSVFAPSERNAKWYELQMSYLRRTVSSFEHLVVANRIDSSLFKESKALVGRPLPAGPGLARRKLAAVLRRCSRAPRAWKLWGTHCWTEHAWALTQLLEYFHANPGYDNYLILDSDAFPFKDGWLDALLAVMTAKGDRAEKQFAAVVRTDNLDTFPHPCVFFIKGAFLRRSAFSFKPRSYTNLAGDHAVDVGAGISPTHRGVHVFLPLLRSNVFNAHPILGGIYGGMFYHHGAGSRGLALRMVDDGYYDHIIPRGAHERIEQGLYRELCHDPEALLARLTGSVVEDACPSPNATPVSSFG